MGDPIPSRAHAALAGAAAGAVAIGANELLAAILPGAPSFVAEIGAAVIALQPPGAKQFVVDLFGTNDKLVFGLLTAAVAIAGAAVLGIVARRRFGLAALGFAGAGLAAMAISLRVDTLVDPLLALVSTAVTIGAGIGALRALLALAPSSDPAAEMPDWSRRRFIGTSLAVGTVAVASGVLGRVLLEQGGVAAPPVDVPPVPEPSQPPPSLEPGTELGIDGLSPVVTPNADFYRIDTALITPRLDAATWQLTVSGMVDRPLLLSYEELLERPLVERYVTIACVSNEVGGDLVGNASWSGVALADLLDLAGPHAEATQVVGRAVDDWTAGFPMEVVHDGRPCMVAVTMNGEPLPVEHGFPARLIVPGLYGYVSATKWLTEIELTTWEAFDGYWIPRGWSKEGPIKTQSRIDVPRAGATVEAGRTPVAGVAWAPTRSVQQVEVRVDDGPWEPARLSGALSANAWVQWLHVWEATPGEHRLTVRATDGDGRTQTAEVAPPAPSGATGHHTITVDVT
jgi:DMSO/TMAO reductase YedYZ molybdopterin-dependent catalytic subunit